MKSAFFALATLALAGTATAQTTVTARIAASSDDAEIRSTQSTDDLTSSDLELGDDNNGSPRSNFVGLRFTGLTVPAGATITDAYVQFHADPADVATDVNTGTPSYTIVGQTGKAALTFGGGNTFTTAARPRTTASVTWSNVPVWQATDGAGVNQRTPNLSAIVTEQIGGTGLAPTDAIVIIVNPQDNYERTVLAFDEADLGGGVSGPTAAPLLSITYTGGATSVDEWTMYH